MSSSLLPLTVRSSHVLRGSLVLAAGLITAAPALWAQGALTPPGAPAPSMKTLSEIETRIAVQSLPGDVNAVYLITQPGAYYLTGDIAGAVGKSAIAIAVDGVTVDLGGHLITGVAGAVRGIELRGARSHVVVVNGVIRSFDNGGIVALSDLRNSRIEDLTISGVADGVVVNGFSNNTVVRATRVDNIVSRGIALGTSAGAVEQCAVSKANGSGLVVGIIGNVVSNCQVSDLLATGPTSTYGIQTPNARDCTVNDITNTGGGMATGIIGTATTHCSASNIAGSNGAIGINGTMIDDSTANTVYSTAVNSTIGINGSQVSRCRVTAIGTMGGSLGTPTGITGANSVIGCTVSSVGVSTTVQPIGINSVLVRDCTVASIGHTGSNSSATGITASVVSNCYVNQINGGATGFVTGISAAEVSDCTLLTVTGAAGSSTITGIQAEIVNDCRVSVVSGSTAANVAGIAGYRLARHCSLGSLSNTGAGNCYGMQTTAAGRTEDITVNANISYGISVTSSHVVTGCTLSNAVTGIQVLGQRCVVEGNNLTGTHTNGIVVTSGTNTANALVIRNQIRNCTNNIIADAPAQVGPSVSAVGVIASTNPWANFTD